MKKYLAFFCIFSISLSALSASNLFEEEGFIPSLDIIGYFTVEQLQNPPFNSWFDSEYEDYTVDTVTLNQIGENFSDSISITIVIGTWCSDSQRETPRFVKILEYLDYNFRNLTAIGVDRMKKAEGTNVDKLGIEFVPTIIFYKDDKEIGRIIETPEESLEKDLLKIISRL